MVSTVKQVCDDMQIPLEEYAGESRLRVFRRGLVKKGIIGKAGEPMTAFGAAWLIYSVLAAPTGNYYGFLQWIDKTWGELAVNHPLVGLIALFSDSKKAIDLTAAGYDPITGILRLEYGSDARMYASRNVSQNEAEAYTKSPIKVLVSLKPSWLAAIAIRVAPATEQLEKIWQN